MSRIIFILVLLVVGYLLLKSWQRRKRITAHNKQHQGSGLKTHHIRMVACDQCGLHVPEPEAVKHGGQCFCSLEHAQQALITRNQHSKDKR